MPKAELARDVRSAVARVEHGSEAIIEHEDHQPDRFLRLA